MRVLSTRAEGALKRKKRLSGDELFPAAGADRASAAARALAILEAVSRSPEPVSAVELSPRLDLPKPTVHRLMLLLEDAGFLQREPGSKRFITGHRLMAMSLEALINAPNRAERHAVLQALVDEIQETCNLTILVGNEVVYLDRVECHWPLRTHFHVGSRVPAHCTASGKLFLGLMPAAKRSRLLRLVPLKKYTDKTLVDPARIETELKEVRAKGIGVDVEEFISGLIGLAVPVVDRRERICATVAMHAPTQRVTAERMWDFVPALQRAAKAIGKTL
ncbi:MAG: IclR family transcriptional regulator [Hyphomicrobiaceae bacterium]|nr:MAG: IclR family transcriptional regulator [Hyphomicrobiaceae bacterium]